MSRVRALRIHLRTYEPDDFETLYEIDQACYPSEVAYSRSELRSYLAFLGSECIVAEVDEGVSSAGNTIAGNKRVRPKVGGFCISAHQDTEGYIVTIDVLERYRRHGVGSALLQEIEGRLAADGVRRISLETATDNAPVVAFWRRHGYRVHGVREGYYPRGRDAYSMSKGIASAGSRR